MKTNRVNLASQKTNNIRVKLYEKIIKKLSGEAKKDAEIDYDLVSNIMMLLESTIILNPRISKKRKYFIMKCFQFYNENQLDKKRTKLKNAKKLGWLDLYSSLEQDIAFQMLFNQEYENSIQEERITPGLLELLNTRHHNKELVPDFMAYQEYSPKVQDWMKQDSADIATSQYAATLFDDPSELPPPNSLMNDHKELEMLRISGVQETILRI